MTHSTKSQNLIGRRFGRLIVIKRLSNKNSKKNWLCQCDCGKEHSAPGYSLKRGTTQSCGCFRIETCSLPGDEARFNEAFGSYVSNAKRRNYVFELTKIDFRKIAEQSCVYCGAEPKPLQPRNRKFSAAPFVCNGVDRVDNAKGYVLGNCVSCCGLCNRMKRELTSTEFKEHVRRIFLHQELN
jgi:hypothetical protein